MQVIQEANTDILKLWGAGKILTGSYRLLTYTISEPIDGGTLLLNVVTGEMVLLNVEEAQKLNSLPRNYEPWMDAFIKKHYLVHIEADDKKSVDTLRSIFQIANKSNEINYYKVLPTTHCNAHCFYCYESRFASCESMSDETADRLAEFMIAHKGELPIHVHWFGGEPLVGIRQIDRICKALRDRQIEFFSTMTSNAYLLNAEIAGRAKEDWHLESIQITLDGTEKIYNETKAYKNAADSPYKRVLHNIGDLLENSIHVSIRLNIGLHNIDDLNLLVDELAERFPDKAYLSVYSRLLIEDCGFSPVHFNPEEIDFLHEAMQKIDDKIMRLLFAPSNVKLPFLLGNRCMADNDASLLVLPSGKLGKCNFYDKGEHFVGDILSGITNSEEIKLHKECVTSPKCTDCRLYPSCIQLKICIKCNTYLRQARFKDTVRAMKVIYEDFLRNNIENTTPKENPVFRKEKLYERI